ncbi:MAG: twin-arginine translocase TatA/TatE family subunit [Candidatus Kapabacteria bacterium]|nr:twin-arginine translocase TatA/TatE family subunit [Candidatus Kapabacteria bacterium]
MFDIGSGELILIVIAVLMLFGPKKLPEIAQMMGKGMKKVKEAQITLNEQMKNLKSEMKIDIDDDIKPLQNFKRDQILDTFTSELTKIDNKQEQMKQGNKDDKL